MRQVTATWRRPACSKSGSTRPSGGPGSCPRSSWSRLPIPEDRECPASHRVERAEQPRGLPREIADRPAPRPVGVRILALAPRVLAVVLAGGLAAVVIVNWDRWVGAAGAQWTDDATLNADVTPLAAQVAGRIKAVRVTDYQRVHHRRLAGGDRRRAVPGAARPGGGQRGLGAGGDRQPEGAGVPAGRQYRGGARRSCRAARRPRSATGWRRNGSASCSPPGSPAPSRRSSSPTPPRTSRTRR